MSDRTQTETWQVEVGGQIYDAAFTELPQWIAEGALLPDDKVRKGNLRWIEAKRVPALIPFFNVRTTDLLPKAHVDPRARDKSEAKSVLNGPVVGALSGSNSGCSVHSNEPAEFICATCGSLFCRACPSSYGGSVRICPACGNLCKSTGERTLAGSRASANAVLHGKFGMADFVEALAHPLKFRSSLLLGGAAIAAFTLGQSAAIIGGIALSAAALICLLFANAVSFSVLSHTVDRFAHGDTGCDILPGMDDFSLWDNVVHPFFLSVGAYLVSFGPFLLTISAALYLVFSAIGVQKQAVISDLEKIPGTDYYAGREISTQTVEVKEVLNGVAARKDREIANVSNSISADTDVIDREAKEQEALWELAQASRKAQLESTFGKTTETREREFDEVVAGFLKLAAPIFVIGVVTFLWGVFFFPAASAVAGYTRSFVATINPTIGFDTIRRLGLDYVKILLMAFALAVAYLLAASVIHLLLAPFDLPGLGNLPAKGLSAFVYFYLFAVFSCMIGFALMKGSDRLKLPR